MHYLWAIRITGAVLILERYIIREIFAPLAGICTVLIMIFAGHTAIRFLNDAVNGLLSGRTVVVLLALKVLIALEVLLPVTLYLAIVLALSRLYADGEITAMEACGIGQGRIIISILLLSLLLSLMVTGFSLFVRPWAYEKIYALEDRAKIEFDFDKVEAGRFYELGKDLVFYAEELDPDRMQARNVWVWDLGSGKRKVTTAQNAYQVNGPGQGEKAVIFRNGFHCVLDMKTGSDYYIWFQENVLRLENVRTGPPEYRRKAALTAHLAGSPDPKDIAEYQWRLSTGFSTVLMSLLAIPLSRVAPRRSKNGKVIGAIILFFVFYNLNLIAKTWVEKQVVGSVPGIWWVNVLLAVLVLILLPVPRAIRSNTWRRYLANGGAES
jgi:lipopolysaccharide export system permease protein